MSEQKVKREAEPLFEIREYEAELFAPIEGRVEVKQERTAEAELLPDMSSMIEGVMEPMVMMLTLGMVMPVMQQAMVGVLQSTEVTVVVKPGSVVSVDITNSVLAVEVHGGNVNVQLVNSTIALPTDIQGSTIAMPVDIQAQTANLKVDIAAQSIEKIAIDIVSQSIGNVSVNIADVSGEVTFNVKAKDGYFYIRTEEEVNITIVNPTNVPIYTGETGNTVFKDWSATGFMGSVSIEDKSGYHGRFLRYMFDIAFNTPVDPSQLGLVYLWIILDGFDFQVPLTWIASLNGMIHVTKATSNAWVHADFLSREGGLTAVLFDESGKIKRVIGIWEVQHEFENSWEIWFINDSSSADVIIRYEVSYYL